MAQKKATIIKVSDEKVSIGMEDGSFFDVSRDELDFTPKIGDDVSVFSSGDLVVVTKVNVVEEKKEDVAAVKPIQNSLNTNNNNTFNPNGNVFNFGIEEQSELNTGKNLYAIFCLLGGVFGLAMLAYIVLLLLSEDFCDFIVEELGLSYGCGIWCCLMLGTSLFGYLAKESGKKIGISIED